MFPLVTKNKFLLEQCTTHTSTSWQAALRFNRESDKFAQVWSYQISILHELHFSLGSIEYAHVFFCKEMSTSSSPTCLVPCSSPPHFHSPLKGVLFSLCKHYATNKQINCPTQSATASNIGNRALQTPLSSYLKIGGWFLPSFLPHPAPNRLPNFSFPPPTQPSVSTLCNIPSP